MEVRYRLVYPEWCDWYIIPADKLDEWEAFEKRAYEEDDDNIPKWAKYIDPHGFTFEKPEKDR